MVKEKKKQNESEFHKKDKSSTDLLTATEIIAAAESMRDELITLRRKLHSIPEAGLQENKTRSLLISELKTHGIKPSGPIAETGIKASITGLKKVNDADNSSRKNKAKNKPSSNIMERLTQKPSCVGIRADMDGLSVPEKSGLPFASKHEGMSHACGHDLHMTCLVGALRILEQYKDRFFGSVTGLFQPAEEGPGGAERMIKEGALKNPDIEAVIALHSDSSEPVGIVRMKPGAATACTAELNAVIKGVGGHAASPHDTVDAIVLAAQVINSWQTVVSRSQDPMRPLVLTIGTINGGVRQNVIAESVELSGTIRALDTGDLKAAHRQIEKTLKAITRSAGGNYELNVKYGYPDTVNDPLITENIAETTRLLFGKNAARIIDHGVMGGEDVSYFLKEVPGCFFFMGSGRKSTRERWPEHHPKYNFDEEAIVKGSALLAACFLNLTGQLK